MNAWTTSRVQRSLLSLFCRCEVSLPNFWVGSLTPESVNKAIAAGICADEIITYLMVRGVVVVVVVVGLFVTSGLMHHSAYGMAPVTQCRKQVRQNAPCNGDFKKNKTNVSDQNHAKPDDPAACVSRVLQMSHGLSVGMVHAPGMVTRSCGSFSTAPPSTLTA